MKFKALKVGDIVKRGPDWKYKEQDVFEGKQVSGEVIETRERSEFNIRVRWKGGRADNYIHSKTEKHVVKVNDSPFGIFETFEFEK